MKKTTVILMSLLAGGCASLEDFQAMAPRERADYVCERNSYVSQAKRQVQITESELAEVEQAIAAGYRMSYFCREVPVVTSSQEVCQTDSKGVKTCKTNQKIEKEEACEEKPIPIDGQLEREKESQYRSDLAQLRVIWDDRYDACFNTVRGMSAQEAFDYHKSGSSVFVLESN